jgi:hypothetical protein
MAADRVTLRVNSFQGLQNLAIVMARRLGAFARAGIEVSLTSTNSSAQQLAALASGEYDLIHTAPDNVVNLDTNPAAFGLEHAPRVVMLMGGSNGPLGIYTRPDIPSVERLRGEAVGVDNPGSGFALVLRDLLARNGLELDRDYRFVVAGGTAKRAEGLLARAFAATILYPPFDAGRLPACGRIGGGLSRLRVAGAGRDPPLGGDTPRGRRAVHRGVAVGAAPHLRPGGAGAGGGRPARGARDRPGRGPRLSRV